MKSAYDNTFVLLCLQFLYRGLANIGPRYILYQVYILYRYVQLYIHPHQTSVVSKNFTDTRDFLNCTRRSRPTLVYILYGILYGLRVNVGRPNSYYALHVGLLADPLWIEYRQSYKNDLI